MKVIIKENIILKDTPPLLATKIKRELTFKNPKWVALQQAAKRNPSIYIPVHLPQFLYFFETRGSILVVPKGYYKRALYLGGDLIEKETDRTIKPSVSPITFEGELRDYQAKAIKILSKPSNRYGILEALTGSGKTVMGCYMISQKQTSSLIIVHNKELLYQWIDSLVKFTNLKTEDIGILGDGKQTIGDVTVGIVNTVTKVVEDIDSLFGYVIYDETHRAMSDSYLNIVNGLPCHSHLGLTATPFRKDVLSKALTRIIGPKLHKINPAKLEETGAVLIPHIIKVNSDFYTPNADKVEYSTIINKLTKSKTRNRLIAQLADKDFSKYHDPIMIVSDRIEHCETIANFLSEYPDIKPIVLNSKIPKKKRTKYIQELRKGTYNTLIATISLLGEGFDAPMLNALILGTPIKFKGRLIQIVGRVLRPSQSAQPRIYDVRDKYIPMLLHSGYARDRVYRGRKWI